MSSSSDSRQAKIQYPTGGSSYKRYKNHHTVPPLNISNSISTSFPLPLGLNIPYGHPSLVELSDPAVDILLGPRSPRIFRQTSLAPLSPLSPVSIASLSAMSELSALAGLSNKIILPPLPNTPRALLNPIISPQYGTTGYIYSPASQQLAKMFVPITRNGILAKIYNAAAQPVQNQSLDQISSNCISCINQTINLLHCTSVKDASNWKLDENAEFKKLSIQKQEFINLVINELDKKRKATLDTICTQFGSSALISTSSSTDGEKLYRIVLQFLADDAANKQNCVVQHISNCLYGNAKCIADSSSLLTNRSQKLSLFIDFIFLCEYGAEADVIANIKTAYTAAMTAKTIAPAVIPDEFIKLVIDNISNKIKGMVPFSTQKCGDCIKF
jgi:hypothetical protein